MNLQELLHDKDELTKKMAETGQRSISKERSFTGIPHEMKPARFNKFTFCRYWYKLILSLFLTKIKAPILFGELQENKDMLVLVHIIDSWVSNNYSLQVS